MAGQTERFRSGRVGTLAAVIAASSCASCASLVFAPLAPFVVDDLGLGYAEVGALNAAVFAAAAVASPQAGRWVDRIGFGPALTLALAAMSVSLVVAAGLGFAFAWLACAAVAAGIAYGFVNPAANIAVGSGFDPARRGTVMGLKQTGVSVGGILAGVWLPASALAWGWRAALVQVAVMLALAAAASAATLGAPRRRRQPATAGVTAPAARPYALWAGGFLLSCPHALLMTYIVLYATDESPLGAAAAGLLYAAVQGASLVGRVALGALSDLGRSGRRRVLSGAAVGGAASMVGLALLSPSSVAALAAAAVLGGLTAIGWNGVYMAALVDVAPPAAAGAVSGVGVAVNLAGVVLFPLAGGLLLDAGGGFPAVWLAAGAISLGAAACFARIGDLPQESYIILEAAGLERI